MVFSSIVFLFYFLPPVLLAYHLLFLPVTLGIRPTLFRRASNLLLLLISLFFYFWGENLLIWIVLTSTFIDYVAALVISGADRRSVRRLALITSIVCNLGFLAFFKYCDFGINNLQSTLTALGLQATPWLDLPNIALPLGISFYTFQSMSYTIDVYRGTVRATRNLVDFACYVTMFPQLVAGPIVRYRDVAEQLVARTVDIPLFASGVHRFVIGLAKKVLIANTVAEIADRCFAVPASSLSLPFAWLGVIAYALQIYFDFSGYSDMAIGLGRMFGFRYLENFDHPYVASSIQDFWRRWHISLSTWFRDYLYIPLGGSRHSNLRTYANLFTVFFLCGLWHGASWNFVVWGLFHGAFLVVERLGLSRVLAHLPRPVGHVYTITAVLIGWVFFRADNLGHGWSYVGAMFGFGANTLPHIAAAEVLRPDTIAALIVGIAASAPIRSAVRIRLGNLRANANRIWLTGEALATAAGLAALFVIVTMRLAAGAYNPFIYFRF